MTLKFAWLNIPVGGAKSGITYTGELTEDRKKRLLTKFGESVSGLLHRREYVPGMDLGIGPAELATILSSAGMRSSSEMDENKIDSNYFTALTVFVALKSLMDKKGGGLSGAKVLVEGVGKVSTHLMQMITESGAVVVGVSTVVGSIFSPDGIDIERLLELKELHGDQCVHHYPAESVMASESLYLQPADVLIPGARPNSINENNVASIKARVIVPIANIPATPQNENAMHERGISYIPGFVSNSGGIFCWYLARLSEQARENIIRLGLAKKINNLIDEAARKQIPIAALARSQAEVNARKMAAEGDSLLNRAESLARKLAPRRITYIVLKKVLGNGWGREDSKFCRWYFDARYFR